MSCFRCGLGVTVYRVFVSNSDEFNIYTQEAGPGKLTINIDGPSKAKIDVVDRRTGFVTVSYIVEKEGRYDMVHSVAFYSSM